MRQSLPRTLSYISLIASTCLLGEFAHAAMGIQLIGGLVRNSNVPPLASEDAGTNVTPQFADDTALGLGFSFGSGNWRFETGGLYLDRTISFVANNGIEGSSSGDAGDVAVQTVYVPVQIRRSLGRFLSVSAGGYYEMSLTQGYNSDMGLSAGARLRVPLKGALGLFAEGKYNYGIVDFDGVTTRQTQILFGVSWRDQ